MTEWINQLMVLIESSQAQFWLALQFVGLLWVIQFANMLLGYRLNALGIWPRKLYGLPGIAFSPFLHGGWNHLFFNSIPLLILLDLTLLYGWHVFVSLSVVIILVSGFATWLMGRPGVHVGASGVLMGYWGFLLMQSFFQPSVMSVIVALLCLYYLSSLWMNLLPAGEGVSWEGHVFGCAAGILGAFVL